MTESSLPAPGWYPAVDDIEPREAKPKFMKRSMTRKTGAIVAGSALALGVLFGSSVTGSANGSEMGTLKAQVSTLESEVGAAETVALENDTALADAEADLDAALANLAEATGALETATTQMTEMQTAATASQTELDARAARISDLEGQVASRAAAPAPAAPAPAVPAPAAPANVSYDNCTAVRNAGAAPIRRGDAGYGKHLDRDGDGIGCE